MPTPEAIEPVGGVGAAPPQGPSWEEAWNAYCDSLSSGGAGGQGGAEAQVPPLPDGRIFLATLLSGDVAAGGALALTRDDAVLIASLLATLTQLGKFIDAQA